MRKPNARDYFDAYAVPGCDYSLNRDTKYYARRRGTQFHDPCEKISLELFREVHERDMVRREVSRIEEERAKNP